MKSAQIRSLNGLRVLLVEDQSLIALDAEAMLLDLGVGTVDTFAAVDGALSWLASASPDVAVLDINLGAATAFPIAEELRRRAIPFLFTTGYGDSARLPSGFSGAVIVAKPYTPEALQAALAKCLAINDAARPDDAGPA